MHADMCAGAVRRHVLRQGWLRLSIATQADRSPDAVAKTDLQSVVKPAVQLQRHVVRHVPRHALRRARAACDCTHDEDLMGHMYICSYGLYSYGLHGHSLYSYGLYSEPTQHSNLRIRRNCAANAPAHKGGSRRECGGRR